MVSDSIYNELFEKICLLFAQYMKEKRATTQPQKLADLLAEDPNYIYNPKDNLVREGLVEHVGLLPILATTVFPYINRNDVDLGKALIMLAVHDIGETVTGDTMTYLKKDSEAEAEEEIAIGLLDPYYHKLYRLAEHPSTPTSQFAKAMDKCVADFMDYLCPVDITMQRYKEFINVNTPEEIIAMKREHKASFFAWDPFMKDFFELILKKTSEKLIAGV